MLTRRFLLTSGATVLLAGLGSSRFAAFLPPAEAFPITHTEAEWRRLLTPDQYAVLRESATERPFSSPLLDEHRPGVFACAGCSLGVFSSETKFESGTGWAEFLGAVARPIGRHNERYLSRYDSNGGSLSKLRLSPWGHVFKDGPKVTGLRYCINGVAMTFKPQPA
jgi:peptide-methionine (R)-S-oxide reductase